MDTTTTSRTGALNRSLDEFISRLNARTLLAVWAHPDDESYLAAGLMAAAAAAGALVVNVTATLGEHGTDNPQEMPPFELAAVRRSELGTALAALGVQRSMSLGFDDGACHLVPDELGARHIATVLDEVQPDVVVTFGPDGVTGHPDHRAVARWVPTALERRGAPTALLTTAVGETWPGDLIGGLHRVGAFAAGYPERRHPLDAMGSRRHDVLLGEGQLGRKLRALHSHRSQIGPVERELGPAGYRRLAAVESYRPANQIASRLLTDLVVGETAVA